MKKGIELAKAYLELEMREEARLELLAVPRNHPDFIECWSELVWLSNRSDIYEQRRFVAEGTAMIENGCRDSQIIENTALCMYFAGDFLKAYEFTVRHQHLIKWSMSSRYGFATFASRAGFLSDAAWLVWLAIRSGGDSHIFFDLDFLPLWDFGAAGDLDSTTALALAHPVIEAEFEKLAGKSTEIDHSMEHELPERFRPHLRYLLGGGFQHLSPTAPDAVREDFEAWRKSVAQRIEGAVKSAINHARDHLLKKQLPWAIRAAKRGDLFAARWHTQFALASRPDWLPAFSSKLQGLGMRKVMEDLTIALSRREDFCQVLLTSNIISDSHALSDPEISTASEQVAEIGRGTGYEMTVRGAAAAAEGDTRSHVAWNLALMRRWPSDPAAASNLLLAFCSAGQWASADWLFRRSPRSLHHFTHARPMIEQIKDRRFKMNASPEMKDPFYGQPDIAELVRDGHPLWAALGPLRRRHEPTASRPGVCIA